MYVKTPISTFRLMQYEAQKNFFFKYTQYLSLCKVNSLCAHFTAYIPPCILTLFYIIWLIHFETKNKKLYAKSH